MTDTACLSACMICIVSEQKAFEAKVVDKREIHFMTDTVFP